MLKQKLTIIDELPKSLIINQLKAYKDCLQMSYKAILKQHPSQSVVLSSLVEEMEDVGKSIIYLENL